MSTCIDDLVFETCIISEGFFGISFPVFEETFCLHNSLVLHEVFMRNAKITITFPEGSTFHVANVKSIKVVRKKSGEHHLTYTQDVRKVKHTDYGNVVETGIEIHTVSQNITQVLVEYPKKGTLRETRTYNFVKEKQ